MPDPAAATRPLVSVITVCFNAGRHLAGAMESVLAQTYPAIEYLIIDGGSTDGTLDIIRSFEPRFGGRLRWVSERDDGIYDAMNKGIALATGTIIGLLNADDEYLPDTVDNVVDAVEASPESDAVYGDAVVLAPDGRVLRTERASVLAPGDHRPDRMPMCHQSLFVKRDAYERVGMYDASFRVLADYDWVLRALAGGLKMTYIPVSLARFRTGGVCSTDMRRSNAEREIIRVRHGANPLVERARRIRHSVNNAVYAVFTRSRPSEQCEDGPPKGGRQ